ncbi:hypothetical protein N8T08_007348 [Aspergillus melleus]|uniref:Uncharacterized protein n=1 Tax=Aspergillus melleus TaxID=138277 RepID=A0ACC3AXX8_9EURO|nr:hypothetical protein N8T08_007348 [Aspergillus melleus]
MSFARLLISPLALRFHNPQMVARARYLSHTSQNFSDANKDNTSSENQQSPTKEEEQRSKATPESNRQTKSEKAKSISQADDELRERLEQMSGGGGASGIEYEDGQPNTMKRSVRNNMFRYI